MAAFLYFFPGRRDVTTADSLPDNCGLSDVLNGAGFTYGTIVQNGPDNHGGNIVSVRAEPGGTQAECIYQPATQTWVRCVNAAKETTHYLGFETANPPRAVDLIRGETVNGSRIMLGGQQWLIPVVQAGSKFNTLPKTFQMKDGELFTVAKPEYADLQTTAEAIFRHYVFKEAESVTFQTVFEYVVGLLRINYRVGRYEVCALNLIDTQNVMKPVEASLGFDAYAAELDAQKKTDTPTAG